MREERENKGGETEENTLSGGGENNGTEVMSEETEASEAEIEDSEVQEEKGDSEMHDNESEDKSEDSDTIPVLDNNDVKERLLCRIICYYI